MTEYDIQEPTPADDVIDKQERVEAVIAHELAEADAVDDARYARLSSSAPTFPTSTAPGATYSQAEAASLKAEVDALKSFLITKFSPIT